jgi:MoaA/NifB/PqqE/SkfB family radical SAM enzyme
MSEPRLPPNHPTPEPGFARRQVVERLPRVPLEVEIDLTYRCNNCCRHCWLWVPDTSEERAKELSFDEWREVVDQARALGTRQWGISGGEPMLRPDFSEIFEYVTSKAMTYSLNTNGTLITPEIARLLRRKGNKMVAVYGATAEVYDHVTRNPGGFEALIQGLSYLKEAGAGFTVQLIPMRDNWHQWREMIALAESWSKHWRVGATWLWKTACGDPARNAEIERQRLDPADILELDSPASTVDGTRSRRAQVEHNASIGQCGSLSGSGQPYTACIQSRRTFHVDPYGGMSLCGLIKDAGLRFNLRRVRGGVSAGAVRSVWEDLVPALADLASSQQEEASSCTLCELREDCLWCEAYAYLEHRAHGAKIDSLCALAREIRALSNDWARNHTRYFEVAGIRVCVESDLPMNDSTFHSKFAAFQAEGPGPDTVVFRHHFRLPDLDLDGAEEIYRKKPWVVFRKGRSWVYAVIATTLGEASFRRVALFSEDHSRAEIYNADEDAEVWRRGGLNALTLFPTDQIVLGRLLADRQACLLHSGALMIDGEGLVFVGHSDAGKSTTMELVRAKLGNRVAILCDDRNVVRCWPEGVRVHGTWSHGDVRDVSSASAPLRAILFLEQHQRNEVLPLTDRRETWRLLLATLVKPLVDADWWNKELDVLERIVADVPCFVMRFDRTGAIVDDLENLVR